MASKQDDFDLYDDPYVSTGGNGGADPYADEDDDYYSGNHASHDSTYKTEDRPRDDSVKKETTDQSRPSNREGHTERRSSSDPYGSRDQSSFQSQSSLPHGSATGGDTGGYDSHPDSSRDSRYPPSQQQQQHHDHHQAYPRQPQQNSYGSQPGNGGSYGQHSQPQQQQQQQASGSGGREQGKMFIGGLNWETTDESLKAYFSRFGELTDCMVMKDQVTNKSRGFGFLTFTDAKNVDAVLKEDHHLDGKMIDPKRAIPREEQEKTEKIFVGGIAAEVTEEEFANYFSQFGHVLDATLMLDRNTGRPRGFGFITFESDRGVEAALSRRDLQLHDKAIEVKRAQPKHRTESRGGGGPGGFGGGGGFGQSQSGYGGGNGFGMDAMGAMMGGGYGGYGGAGAGRPDAYQSMGAYAGRYGVNPAAAAVALQRYRMAAVAAAYGGAGAGGPGVAGGYDPTQVMQQYYRQQLSYGGIPSGGGGGGGYGSNQGTGGSGGNGGGAGGSSYNEQDGAGSGGSSQQRRYGSQSGPSGQEASSSYSGHGGPSASYGGGHNGYEQRTGGSGGGQGSGSGYNSNRNPSSSGPGASRPSGPVRGSGGGGAERGGSSSNASGGRAGGGAYHPYQR